LTHNCGVCDNDTGKRVPVKITEEHQQRLKEFRETYFPVLRVETSRSNLINGIAASWYGVSNVGAALHRSKYDGGGNFPDWLVILTLKAFRKHFGNPKIDLLLYVPPTESGDLVRNFAEKIGSALKIPVSYKLVKTSAAEPQKVFMSAISKRENVRGKFIYQDPEEIAGKSILLVDDIFDSGCTIKEIGRYLTGIGAVQIIPLVIAKTVGGDI